MNWNAVAALAEMVGAVGVVISLAYLALQVRQNTQQVRLNSESLGMSHEMGGAQMSVGIALALVTSADLGDLMARAMSLEPDLTPAERVRFSAFMYAALAGFQAGYYNYQKGFADLGAWKGHEGDLMETMRSPGARGWWRQGRVRFSADFAKYVDQLLKADALPATS